MKAGSVINFVSVFIVCLCLDVFLKPVFNLANIPPAFLTNVTMSTIATSVISPTALSGGLPYDILNATSPIT